MVKCKECENFFGRFEEIDNHFCCMEWYSDTQYGAGVKIKGDIEEERDCSRFEEIFIDKEER